MNTKSIPKKKYFLLAVPVIVVLLLFLLVKIIPAGREKEAPANIDLSLENEIAQAQVVRDTFFTAQAEDMSVENPQEAAAGFIPDGAQCTDISVLGTVVYIDYRLDNVRYLIAYYQDGVVEKAARAEGSNDIYSIDSNGNGGHDIAAVF